MEFPDDLLYTKEHEWVRVVDGGANAYIGITDFAQKELDELVYVEVETVGEELAEDDVFGIVEAVKTTSDLYMPVGGEVLEFNQQLSEDGGDNPGLLNEDPYGEGWIVKIRLSDPSEVSSLMSASAYQDLVS
ncbi:MAG: glycine cleavage system protein GcvH [Saprospiraceae bacterium]